MKGEFLKKNLLSIILAVLAIGLVCGLAVVYTNQQSTLADQKDQIAELQSKKESAQAKADANVKSLVTDVTGYDSTRKLNDDVKMRQLFKTAFSWDSGEAYKTARETVMKNYGIPEDSQFMTGVMAPLTEYEVAGYKGTEGDGRKHNYIDDNALNMSFTDMKSSVTNIDDGTYTYFAVVTTSSKDEKSASASADVVVTYTMDKDGNIGNLSAYGMDSAW